MLKPMCRTEELSVKFLKYAQRKLFLKNNVRCFSLPLLSFLILNKLKMIKIKIIIITTKNKTLFLIGFNIIFNKKIDETSSSQEFRN
jgi:hypothetical protein